MTRMLGWLLLAANLLLFIAVRWGGALVETGGVQHVQKELHSDKVHLVVRDEALVDSAATPPTCQVWGEFSGSELARAERLLVRQIPEERWTRRFVERNNGFWVFISPASPAMQVKRSAELRVSGITDFFVVKEVGPLQGAISLGLFKQRDVAEKLLIRLRAKGVQDAKLEPYLTRNTYAVFEIGALSSQELGDLMELKALFPKSKLTSELCTPANYGHK